MVEADRVRAHTARGVNARIDEETRQRVRRLAGRSPEEIAGRLRALAGEWDIERVLEANASVLALTGLALGNFVNRRWLLLPAVVLTFLLQHAVQGWCPPIELFRRLGIRTRAEIDAERTALKAIRRDFEALRLERDPGLRAETALSIARS